MRSWCSLAVLAVVLAAVLSPAAAQAAGPVYQSAAVTYQGSGVNGVAILRTWTTWESLEGFRMEIGGDVGQPLSLTAVSAALSPFGVFVISQVPMQWTTSDGTGRPGRASFPVWIESPARVGAVAIYRTPWLTWEVIYRRGPAVEIKLVNYDPEVAERAAAVADLITQVEAIAVRESLVFIRLSSECDEYLVEVAGQPAERGPYGDTWRVPRDGGQLSVRVHPDCYRCWQYSFGVVPGDVVTGVADPRFHGESPAPRVTRPTKLGYWEAQWFLQGVNPPPRFERTPAWAVRSGLIADAADETAHAAFQRMGLVTYKGNEQYAILVGRAPYPPELPPHTLCRIVDEESLFGAAPQMSRGWDVHMQRLRLFLEIGPVLVDFWNDGDWCVVVPNESLAQPLDWWRCQIIIRRGDQLYQMVWPA